MPKIEQMEVIFENPFEQKKGTTNVGEFLPQKAKINRDDPGNPAHAGPFANLVKGEAVQVTPNGSAFSWNNEQSWAAEGFRGPRISPRKIFGGNRSGE